MVSTDINGTRFSLRSAGIAVKDGFVMLNKGVDEPYWFIPGGRVEEGEDSPSAILREMREEIGQDVRIRELACVIENFFILDGRKAHEIGFYYFIDVPQSWEGPRFIEDGSRIEYRWLKLEELEQEALYPAVIKDVISGREARRHLIVKE
jgi:ADP-ribose pyrophosphatase YjhB (NUDIX family)